MSHEGGVVACNQLKASLSDSHLLLFLSEQYLWRRFTILTGESVAAVFHEGSFEDSCPCMCSMLCGRAPKRKGLQCKIEGNITFMQICTTVRQEKADSWR